MPDLRENPEAVRRAVEALRQATPRTFTVAAIIAHGDGEPLRIPTLTIGTHVDLDPGQLVELGRLGARPMLLVLGFSEEEIAGAEIVVELDC